MIKQGYMLRVTSWENDGDCYNTKTFDGLTDVQAKSLVAFCEFLNRQDQIEANEIDFGNFIQQNSDFVGFSGWEGSMDQEFFEELAYEVVGCGYETGMLRVCERWDVHYIPLDILEVKF